MESQLTEKMVDLRPREPSPSLELCFPGTVVPPGGGVMSKSRGLAEGSDLLLPSKGGVIAHRRGISSCLGCHRGAQWKGLAGWTGWWVLAGIRWVWDRGGSSAKNKNQEECGRLGEECVVHCGSTMDLSFPACEVWREGGRGPGPLRAPRPGRQVLHMRDQQRPA